MRLRRLASGGAAQLAMQALQAGIRLIEVPLLIKAWGIQTYGAWIALSSIALFFSLSDFGVLKAARREIGAKLASSDYEGAEKEFSCSLSLAMLYSTCAALTGLALAWLAFESWSIGEVGSPLLVLCLLIGQQQLQLYQSAFLNCLSADGRYPRAEILLIITTAAACSSLFLTAMIGADPASAAAAYMLTTFVGTIVTAVVVRGDSRLKCVVGRAPRLLSAVRSPRITRGAVASVIGPLAEIISLHGTRLVVGLVLGPAAAVVFSVGRTYSRIALQPVMILSRLMEHELVMSGLSKANRPVLFAIRMLRAIGALSAILALVAFVISPNAVATWTRGEVSLERSFLALLLVAAVLGAMNGGLISVAASKNRHFNSSMALITASALGLTMSLLGGAEFGFTAFGVALVVVEMIVLPFALHNSARVLEMNVSAVILRIITPKWVEPRP